jgi:hypothetical protein
MAQEAGTASDVTERAARGASALLPGEILRPMLVQPTTLWLDLAIAQRATVNDGTLVWTPGMEEIGPDLLALTGCEPGIRTNALREARAALVSQYRTPLEQGLLDVLESAAVIVGGNHTVLSLQITSLFQAMPNCEVEPWRPTGGARIKSGCVQVAVLASPDGEIAAVELRLRQGTWRLPVIISEALLVQFGKRSNQRHRR